MPTNNVQSKNFDQEKSIIYHTSENYKYQIVHSCLENYWITLLIKGEALSWANIQSLPLYRNSSELYNTSGTRGHDLSYGPTAAPPFHFSK